MGEAASTTSPPSSCRWSRRAKQRRRATTQGRCEQLVDESVATLAQLYLGNILYALELAALSLEDQKRPDDAASYRAIARKLATAHGRSTRDDAAPPAPGS